MPGMQTSGTEGTGSQANMRARATLLGQAVVASTGQVRVWAPKGDSDNRDALKWETGESTEKVHLKDVLKKEIRYFGMSHLRT